MLQSMGSQRVRHDWVTEQQQQQQSMYLLYVFPCVSDGKESTWNAGDLGSILGQEDPLEKGMAIQSSIIA